ncbi:hypothetical protein [Bradyrhizobium sp. SHOUNA76]|uniref:hypothetical protein n=1 Tax=Bradyrhizobium sp. SHOUNA76 TaxID=2908927 RepID=UPI001FF64986|nr:hypothetical protein [Bradyrhizobium sp. SHOUNA76]MCJ9699534.1 hypothetical protein [Bradyrhizobium sp. SHOUNA76]
MTAIGTSVKQLRSGDADTSALCRPGFSPARLRMLMKRALAETGLDMSGMTVLTEAATGAYAVTPVLAAMAGAKHVYAFTKPGRHGTVTDVKRETFEIAAPLDVADRIEILEKISHEVLHSVDIVTNSGHLRPLTAALIDQLRGDAVIALMFEAWEFRREDLDIEACARRKIPVVGVNERHPAIDVFSFLGPLAVKQLHDCGLAVLGSRIGLLCDNDFLAPLHTGLASLGANVKTFDSVAAVHPGAWDAFVVALQPTDAPRVGQAEAAHLAACAPDGAVVVQFWGDIDRAVLAANGLAIWPAHSVGQGHMGILLSEIGPEPIIRLQTGGLRAAEWVRRGGAVTEDGFAQLVPWPEVI